MADTLSKKTGAGGRQTPVATMNVSGSALRTLVPETSATELSASLASTGPNKANRGPAELLWSGISVTGKGGNHLNLGMRYEHVANSPDNHNNDNAFNHAKIPDRVSWVVAKKCGWLCVVIKY